MNKGLKLFLICLLASALLCISAFALEIGTADELSAFMSDSSKWGETVTLTADVDMTNKKQQPIGSYEIPFSGSFDGAGHTISGLDITDGFTAGLFGVIENATVKSVTVKGSVANTFAAEHAETKADGKYPGTGGLCAVVLGGVSIENCVCEVNVNAPGNCGGVIGNIYNFSDRSVTVSACENYGTVNSFLGNAGGVIGRIFIDCTAENAVTIKGCINHTDITLTSEDRCRLGGIIGYIRTLAGVVDISECKNLGATNGSNSGAKASNYPYVGGIVGRCEVATGASAAIAVRSSVNGGNIVSTQVAGGIVGYMSRADTCSDNESGVFASVNTANVSGELCSAGILGYSESKSLSSARSAINACVNTGAISSPKSAGGIIARHYGFDIVNSVNLGDVISDTLYGSLTSEVLGDTFCELSGSYYVGKTAQGSNNSSLVDRGSTEIALNDITAAAEYANIDFSTSSSASELYLLAKKLYPDETEAVTEEVLVAETTEITEGVQGESSVEKSPLFAVLFAAAAVCGIVFAVLLITKKSKVVAFVMLVLCAMLLAAALIGNACGAFSSEDEAAGTVTEQNGGLPSPENVDISGDFNFLVAGNWAWNDYECAEENRTVVDDAIYKRNEAIREKYGVNITNEDVVEYASSMGTGTGYRKIYTEYMAGYTHYDAAMVGTYDVASLAYNGFLCDLNSIPYIDLSKPYWDQKANTDLSMNGKMYYTTGEISLADNRSVYTLFFSKGMVDRYGLENPYDLVKNGKWTIETFAKMVKSVGADTNQDGIFDKNDIFGLMTPTDTHLAILAAAGEKVGSVNDEGKIEITLYNERTDMLYDRYLDIVNDHANTYNYQYNYLTGATGLQSTNEERVSMFNNFQALFYSHTMFYTDSLREIDNDFGIVPYPKLDAMQDEYGNLVSPWHSQFLCVPVSNGGTERIGIVLEELAIEGEKLLTPAYYEKTLQGKHVRDAESAEMLDIIFDSLVFDIGAYYNIGTYKDQLGSLPRTGQSLTVIYETYLPMAQTKVDEINAFFEKNSGI